MRRSYLCVAAALAAGVAATVGTNFLLGGGAKGPDNPTAPKNGVSRIVKVTAYPNSALVTREVDVPDGEGLVELVLTPMPAQVVPSSMYSEGAEGIRVLTTRYRTRQVLEDTSEERRKLEAEAEKLEINAAKIASEMASCQKNMDMLTKLEGFTEKATVLSTEKAALNGDAVITLSKYVMETRVEKAKELVALADQKRANDVQIAFCKRKMGELGRGSGREERDAVLVVDREAGKGGKVRLNYLVGSVSWRPEYKLRAAGAKEDVQVDCLANLKQHSGEDWGQVKLTLSTAQPMLNAAPPVLAALQPTLVARGTPGGPPMPGAGAMPTTPFANVPAPREQLDKAMQQRAQARENYGRGGAKDTDVAVRLLNEAAASEQCVELMKSGEDIRAELAKKLGGKGIDPTRNDGPSVTYHLASRITVPSRNDEQIIEVAKLKLTPRYYYKAIPVLSRHVYRLADLVNKSEHVLLPGEATMYQGTDFVGRMPMPLVAVGEEFTAGFGVDPQLQVQRQMTDKARTTQGGNQVLKYDYRILVSSYKSEPVALQVWDRLPHAEAESVGVTLVKATPELSKDAIYLRESRPDNLLRWDLEVQPKHNGESPLAITYEFRLELDRQMAISGFQSR